MTSSRYYRFIDTCHDSVDIWRKLTEVDWTESLRKHKRLGPRSWTDMKKGGWWEVFFVLKQLWCRLFFDVVCVWTILVWK